MSWSIQVIRSKPNPAGKDMYKHSPRHEQLLGEWVDLRNTGDSAVRLSNIYLCNATFLAGCILHQRASIYWNGSNTDVLYPSQIVRVHTGQSKYYSLMASVDLRGVDLHVYAEKGHFILNNSCGDIISVFWKTNEGQWRKEDEASYDPGIPDGAVLVRSGTKLIPSQGIGV